jgi:hypothetical protein
MIKHLMGRVKIKKKLKTKKQVGEKMKKCSVG